MKVDKRFQDQNVILTLRFGEKIVCKILAVHEHDITILTTEPASRQVISNSIISRIEERL